MVVVTLGQQYNVGEKPTVILYTYIVVVFTLLYKKQYNGGFFPDIILLTLRDYIGEPLQTMVLLNPFDRLEGLDAVRFFCFQKRTAARQWTSICRCNAAVPHTT